MAKSSTSIAQAEIERQSLGLIELQMLTLPATTSSADSTDVSSPSGPF